MHELREYELLSNSFATSCRLHADISPTLHVHSIYMLAFAALADARTLAGGRRVIGPCYRLRRLERLWVAGTPLAMTTEVFVLHACHRVCLPKRLERARLCRPRLKEHDLHVHLHSHLHLQLHLHLHLYQHLHFMYIYMYIYI